MKLRTNNYDVTGMTAGRLLRQYLSGKMRPFGDFCQNVRFTHVIALCARHYFGYPMAYLSTRFEPQWRKVLFRWRQSQRTIKKRGDRSGG